MNHAVLLLFLLFPVLGFSSEIKNKYVHIKSETAEILSYATDKISEGELQRFEEFISKSDKLTFVGYKDSKNFNIDNLEYLQNPEFVEDRDPKKDHKAYIEKKLNQFGDYYYQKQGYKTILTALRVVAYQSVFTVVYLELVPTLHAVGAGVVATSVAFILMRWNDVSLDFFSMHSQLNWNPKKAFGLLDLVEHKSSAREFAEFSFKWMTIQASIILTIEMIVLHGVGVEVANGIYNDWIMKMQMEGAIDKFFKIMEATALSFWAQASWDYVNGLYSRNKIINRLSQYSSKPDYHSMNRKQLDNYIDLMPESVKHDINIIKGNSSNVTFAIATISVSLLASKLVDWSYAPYVMGTMGAAGWSAYLELKTSFIRKSIKQLAQKFNNKLSNQKMSCKALFAM